MVKRFCKKEAYELMQDNIKLWEFIMRKPISISSRMYRSQAVEDEKAENEKELQKYEQRKYEHLKEELYSMFVMNLSYFLT